MSTINLQDIIKNILDSQILTSPLANISCKNNEDLQSTSLFASIDPSIKAAILKLCDESSSGSPLKRCMGSMVGMAVADSLGHNFEFLPVCDEIDTTDAMSSYFEYPIASKDDINSDDTLIPPGSSDSASAARTYQIGGGIIHNPLNQFRLKPGQWTDDCSMGLCISDSIISNNGRFNGSNIRKWFWNWWFNGLNNAFRLDKERQNLFGGDSLSIGLGGNIANSLMSIESFINENKEIPPTFESPNEDAGNGSIMRLSPIPIRFHTDLASAREFAFQSSLCTHPGRLAAEACSLMAHIIASAIRLGDGIRAPDFLDQMRSEYISLIDAGTAPDSSGVIKKLLLSEEEDSSTERCWNWRSPSLLLLQTIKNRGARYNGYRVSPTYFGSFSIDGLAMALHAIYHTNSFNDAIVRVINTRGDADSTGSICGQIAGAIYGVDSIDERWRSDLNQWDEREVELRAIVLHYLALLGDEDKP